METIHQQVAAPQDNAWTSIGGGLGQLSQMLGPILKARAAANAPLPTTPENVPSTQDVIQGAIDQAQANVPATPPPDPLADAGSGNLGTAGNAFGSTAFGGQGFGDPSQLQNPLVNMMLGNRDLFKDARWPEFRHPFMPEEFGGFRGGRRA